MLQQVLQGGDFSIFTQIALILFFGSFIVMLALTFLRPRSQTDRFARMPLSDDIDTQPITPRTAPRTDSGADTAETGDETHE